MVTKLVTSNTQCVQVSLEIDHETWKYNTDSKRTQKEETGHECCMYFRQFVSERVATKQTSRAMRDSSKSKAYRRAGTPWEPPGVVGSQC